MAADWHRVGKFAEEHWPYIALGGVALVGMLWFTARSVPDTVAAAPAAATGGGGGSSADPALLAAQITATTQQIVTAGQVKQAQIAADAQQQVAAITAAGQAYNTQTLTYGNLANALAGAMSGQNVQIAQAVASGFSNYILGTAQEVSTAAGSVASTAASNNSTAGNTVFKTLTGAAALVSAFSGSAFGALGGVAAAALGQGTNLPQFGYTGNSIPFNAVQVVPMSGNSLFARTPNALLDGSTARP